MKRILLLALLGVTSAHAQLRTPTLDDYVARIGKTAAADLPGLCAEARAWVRGLPVEGASPADRARAVASRNGIALDIETACRARKAARQ